MTETQARIRALLDERKCITEFLFSYKEELDLLQKARSVRSDWILEFADNITLTTTAPPLWNETRPNLHDFGGHPPAPQFVQMREGKLQKLSLEHPPLAQKRARIGEGEETHQGAESVEEEDESEDEEEAYEDEEPTTTTVAHVHVAKKIEEQKLKPAAATSTAHTKSASSSSLSSSSSSSSSAAAAAAAPTATKPARTINLNFGLDDSDEDEDEDADEEE